MNSLAFTTGFFTGLSLILAIGAQNAFVLRTGLIGRHVFVVCLLCAASDAVLIVFGVTGFQAAAQIVPWLQPVLLIGGVLFLLGYGALNFKSAFTSTEALDTDLAQVPPSLWQTAITCLALTWLNPHVYLDTVVLLGAVSAQFEGAKTAFASGAVLGSFSFFFSLGYGGRLLQPAFKSPKAWRVLDFFVGCVMWTIAAGLITKALA